MAQHPFAQSGTGRKSTHNLRRSTRVDAEIPLFISGRDASAQPFRDETVATTVNVHGARIQCCRNLLVGMHLTIEIPANGNVARAICVRTNETVPGSDVCHISVQLEKPGNIWGIENPPEDWTHIETTGQSGSPLERQRQVASPVSAGMAGAQNADLEEQATQIVDAAAVRLRGLVEEMLALAFDDFNHRLEAALAAAESRVDERAGRSLAQLEGSLKKFEEDLTENLDLHAAQTIASTETTLRTQISGILSSILAPGLQPPATNSLDIKPEH